MKKKKTRSVNVSLDFPTLLHQNTRSKVYLMGSDLQVLTAVTAMLLRDKQLLRDWYTVSIIK